MVLPAGKQKVIIIGDSFLFGDALPYEETFGHKLQVVLGEEYEVLNFAVQGYGLDQIYLFLSQLLERYSPAYMVVDHIEDHDYRNVNRDRRRYFPCSRFLGSKPVFRIRDNTLELVYTPEPFSRYDTFRREYQKEHKDWIVVASYSGAFTVNDGFHLNASGSSKLVEDFMAKFGERF